MHRLLAGSVLVVLAALGGARAGVAGDEPRIRDRPLSHWVTATRNAEDWDRIHAARALGEALAEGHAGPPVVSALVELMDDPAEEARASAIRSLARTRPTEQGALAPHADRALPKLTHVARTSPRRDHRPQAVDAIGAFGPHAAPAVPDLIEFVESDDAPRSQSAAEALGRIGAGAAAAIPVLVEALEREATWSDIYLRRAAAGALAALGPPAVQPLGDALASDNQEVHVRAAQALGRMRPPPLEALSRWLEDPDPRRREGAARALGGGAPPDPAGADALLGVLGDSQVNVRRAALRSLRPIVRGREDAAARILPLLADPDRQNRYDAIRALAEIGPPAVGALLAALEDPDPVIRAGTAATLASLRHDPPGSNPLRPAVERLMRMLRDPAPEVRYWAAEALAVAPVFEELAAVADDDRHALRLGAVYALGKNLRHQARARVVLDAMDDADPAVRREALFAVAAALERRPPPRKLAEPLEDALRAALDDPDPSIRYHAARALAYHDSERTDELLALALKLSREHDITLYYGFEEDLARMGDTFEFEGVRSSGQALRAAQRFARRAPLIGMARAEVYDLLGEPRREFPPREHPPGRAPLVYWFDSGKAGGGFRVHFDEDVVVQVELLTH